MAGEAHTPTLVERAEAAGHVLKRDEDGDLDIFVLDVGYHNGPGCAVCDESWCRHCPDTVVEPCDGGAAKREREAKERIRAAAPDLLEALDSAQSTIAVAANRMRSEGLLEAADALDREASLARAAIARTQAGEGGK